MIMDHKMNVFTSLNSSQLDKKEISYHVYSLAFPQPHTITSSEYIASINDLRLKIVFMYRVVSGNCASKSIAPSLNSLTPVFM
mmetsp:Transcript_4297/g.4737  ORF Transcript_4297/g.4737 Transcript_4297/m.4737 type:complete len:83 (-) Transcript_4297:802-1050(-)